MIGNAGAIGRLVDVQLDEHDVGVGDADAPCEQLFALGCHVCSIFVSAMDSGDCFDGSLESIDRKYEFRQQRLSNKANTT